MLTKLYNKCINLAGHKNSNYFLGVISRPRLRIIIALLITRIGNCRHIHIVMLAIIINIDDIKLACNDTILIIVIIQQCSIRANRNINKRQVQK